MIRESRQFLLKPGEAKTDLDAAMTLARQAIRLSEKIGFPEGVDSARYQLGLIFAEGKQYDSARNLLPGLSIHNRSELMETLISYRVNTAGATLADVDSAKVLWDTLRTMTAPASEIADWLATIGLHYNHKGDSSKGVRLLDSAFRLAMACHAPRIAIRTVFDEVVIYGGDSTTDRQIMKQMTALANDDTGWKELLAKSDKLQNAMEVLCAAGYKYFRIRRLEMAKATGLVAIKINERLHQHFSNPYFLVGVIHNDLGQLDKALEYAHRAINMTEAAGGAPTEVLGYLLAGRVYYTLEKWEESLGYLQKALTVLLANPHTLVDLGGFCRRTVSVYLKLDRPAEALGFINKLVKSVPFTSKRDKAILELSMGNCYHALKQYTQAESHFQASIAYLHDMEPYDRGIALFDLARFYSAEGKYRQALIYLSELTGPETSKDIPMESLRESHFLLYQADSALGNYQQAMLNLRRYQQINDSLFNVAKNRQLEEMNTKYETDKKDRNIAHLQTEAQLQKTVLARTRMIRNGLVGGAILLALLLILYFNRYRLKQRINLQLEQMTKLQKRMLDEKEWMIKEINHRVKNNLQIILSMLKMQTEYDADDRTRATLDDISSRILAISLVHQKLYNEVQDSTSIHMPDYVQALAGFLEDGIAADQKIRFILNISPIDLPVAQAVSVGLILNEAITNAIKHAFTADRHGVIRIGMQLEKNQVRLTISDNGKGLYGAVVEEGEARSLGMQLIRTLSDQLDGILSMESNDGLTITIVFPIAATQTNANASIFH